MAASAAIASAAPTRVRSALRSAQHHQHRAGGRQRPMRSHRDMNAVTITVAATPQSATPGWPDAAGERDHQ